MADGWQVTGQQQRTDVSGTGQFQQVVEVHFRTAHGNTGSVRVPLSAFTPDEVHKRISEYAATLDAVHNL